jgi:hypothetical protein
VIFEKLSVKNENNTNKINIKNNRTKNELVRLFSPLA